MMLILEVMENAGVERVEKLDNGNVVQCKMSLFWRLFAC